MILSSSLGSQDGGGHHAGSFAIDRPPGIREGDRTPAPPFPDFTDLRALLMQTLQALGALQRG